MFFLKVGVTAFIRLFKELYKFMSITLRKYCLKTKGFESLLSIWFLFILKK